MKDGIGFECSFPGTHSNLGGGYPDKTKEERKYLSYRDPEKMNNSLLIDWRWFKKMGFYLESQLTEIANPADKNPHLTINYPNISVDRTTVHGTHQIRYHYQFILVKIMKDIMQQETTVELFPKTNMYDHILEMKSISVLKAFRDLAHSYVLSEYKQAGDYQISQLNFEQMKLIYNQYLHNSLVSEPELSSGSANEGTRLNKTRKRNGSLNYMLPTRPKVTTGYKYR